MTFCLKYDKISRECGAYADLKKTEFLWAFVKTLLIFLSLAIQVALIGAITLYFNSHFSLYLVFNAVVGIVMGAAVVADNTNPSYKIAWLIPILAFPMFGGTVYLFLSRKSFDLSAPQSLDLSQSVRSTNADPPALSNTLGAERDLQMQSNYLSGVTSCPPLKIKEAIYYNLPVDFLKEYLADLKSAQSSIYMEYFIICKGRLWSEILEILKVKAKQGVDVRIIWDAVGSMLKLPCRYEKYLRRYGIRCCAFLPTFAVLSPYLNMRNHRKITVIDGNIAYTGGINLSDEYVGYARKFGVWKDCAIKLTGEAAGIYAQSFTRSWNFCSKDKLRYEPRPIKADNDKLEYNGIVHPYFSSPLDLESIGENVYMNMINRAKRSVYIMTPYLIPSNEMLTSLKNAAAQGVDVRIITPGIPDKKTVWAATRSYFPELLRSNVRIFEYTPGFVHSKTLVVDSVVATVGSYNFDFRSLYLHYECGAWLCDCSAALDIERDFLDTQKFCKEIHLSHIKTRPISSFLRALLKALAPLI